MPADANCIRVKAMLIAPNRAKTSHAVSVNKPTRENPKGFHRLIGGSVEFGETHAAAIEREVAEELSATIRGLRYLGVVENLFHIDDVAGHEIVFLYTGELDPEPAAAGATLTESDGSIVPVVWRPLVEAAETVPLYPAAAIDMLQQATGTYIPLPQNMAAQRVVVQKGRSSGPLPAEGKGRLAHDFIPESHRHLPMLRILLPLRDNSDQLVRWSDYVSLDFELASLDWWQVVGRVIERHPEIRFLNPSTGELDTSTANALQETLGDRRLNSLRWMGYAGNPVSSSPVRVFGDEYFAAPLRADGLQAGERIPEFAWDDGGALAWGSRLYPDSLIIAADIALLKQLHADPRLDSIVVRPDTDVVPPSSGD